MVPIVVGMVEWENHARDTTAIRMNANGTRDYGLGQINSSNFPMLSRLFGHEVTTKNILDECLNLKAAQAILFVRYNGNPPPEVAAAYAAGAEASIARVSLGFPQASSQAGQSTTQSVDVWQTAATLVTDVRLDPVEPDEQPNKAPPPVAAKPPPPPAWDVWGSEVYRRQQADGDKPEEAK